MNLVLGIVWLIAALALFGYEFATGERPLRIRIFNDVSAAWVFLLLAAWNFVRWYSSWMGRKDQDALRIVHEARLRQARHRERPTEPDPTFDFTDSPTTPPAPRPPSEQPPSSN
jgi:hypothetical protein